MKNLDSQIANIESLLQQILRNTSDGGDRYEDSDTAGCPFCGCEDDHGDHRSKALDSLGPSPRKGKTVIMISKKGKKNGQSEMPDVLKDIMGSLMGSET